MLLEMYVRASEMCADRRVSLLIIFLALTPAITAADIVWDGSFSDGSFRQYYPSDGDTNDIRFSSVPAYGRPIQYGGQNSIHVGNGDLLSLVAKTNRTVNGINYRAGPTRGNSEFAAKFTVKNSANGIEPDDCDPTPADTCDRRRTVLKMQARQYPNTGAFEADNEKVWWASVSVYFPSDFPANTGGSYYNIFSIKMDRDAYNNTGWFAIEQRNSGWHIRHSWDDYLSINDRGGNVAPERAMIYAGEYDGQPYPGEIWPQGKADFPNYAEGMAALQSLNIGGWTDWIVEVRQDWRPLSQGGHGYLKLYKREDSGPWITVLDIRPRDNIDRGFGLPFDRGIGFNLSSMTSPGSGTQIGFYTKKSTVWNKEANSTMYFANHKIGDENTSFSEMSPDGSSPSTSEPAPIKPNPPTLTAISGSVQ